MRKTKIANIFICSLKHCLEISELIGLMSVFLQFFSPFAHSYVTQTPMTH